MELLKSPLFVGEFELMIDEKSRLSIPAEVRRLLDPSRDGECFFLVFGMNRRPWLYTERAYENLAEQVPADISPGEEMLMYDQLTFALASRVEMDKAGRILIPERTMRRTGLSKDMEITLFGARDHFEIWPRKVWNEFVDANQDRIADISSRAKHARGGNSGSNN